MHIFLHKHINNIRYFIKVNNKHSDINQLTKTFHIQKDQSFFLFFFLVKKEGETPKSTRLKKEQS